MNAGVLNRTTTAVIFEPGQRISQNIEMQQNSMANSLHILSRPTAITSQPQADTQHPNRPSAANTVGSMSTPRSQLNVLSKRPSLGNVEQLEIQQIVDMSTLLGRSDKKFQYRVKVSKSETLFLVMQPKPDTQLNGWASKIFPCDFSLNVLDQCGETTFIMKINSSWTYTLNKLHKITVQSSTLIGTIEEKCNIIGSRFTVYDAARKQLCNLYGPNVCGCCMYREAHFQVISIDGTHQIASLIHQWDNTLHDYILLITCSADTDIKLKSLLLGAAFLVEHMYFQQVNRTSL